MAQTEFHKALKKFKIKILGFPYKVKFVKDMLDKFHMAGCGGVYSGEISLEPAVTNLDILSSLIHELIEISFVKMEARVKHNVISQIEVVLMDLLISNPELFELIIQEVRRNQSNKKRKKSWTKSKS